MYLKKANTCLAKKLSENVPFVPGTWYIKMNENGTPVKTLQGQSLYTCMNNEALYDSLKTREFTHVEY